MELDPTVTTALKRRAFLGRGMAGLGLIALNSLIDPQLFAAADAADPAAGEKWMGVVNPLHFPAKAKRVIYLYQAGGPSHLETFDYKPKLREMHGQAMPESFTKGQQIAQLQGKALTCFGPQFGFATFGKSGQRICELFPHIGGVADDVCIIRSMWTEQINHDPAHTFMNTGSIIAGRPSMGSWLLYGLGADTENLPGFVVLLSAGQGGQMQPIAARQWSAGFLPSKFQGVKAQFVWRSGAVHQIIPHGIDARAAAPIDRRDQRAGPGANTRPLKIRKSSRRIAQYEMAFKMQSSVPDLVDMSKEPQSVLEMYGAKPGDGSFASNCLLARRLAERGVRFIQLYHRDWDHHSAVKGGHRVQGRGNGPADRRADRRSEAARHAGRHAGGLGRRVRAHADVARRRWPRSPHQGLLLHAGGRRHQGAASATARPTNSAMRRSRIR